MKALIIPLLAFWMFTGLCNCAVSQETVSVIQTIEGLDIQKGKKHKFWLSLWANTFGQPITVPLIIVKGNSEGPTLCLVAAIHGNELNGIPIIHRLMDEIDPGNLKGSIVAIPGVNAVSIPLDRRRFIDEEDLNRNFPGKEKGNRSQQYVYKIIENVVSHTDFLIDMHTASFGRENSYYARADLSNDTLLQLATLQGADIILNSEGLPSAGNTKGQNRTLRAEAWSRGIYPVTVEYGNPQVYQPELIQRGIDGIFRTLSWLGMYSFQTELSAIPEPVICQKSFWIYMEEGGFLEVLVNLTETISKGQQIARVRNGFGEIIKSYYSPQDGIVIGKSSNPVNMSGGRILHLGIPTR